jgi:amidase
MSGFGEYERYDALGLAALVARREVSPEELLEAAIARVEARNPMVNAVTMKLYDYGRKAIAAGLPDGAFRGVPYLMKDLTASIAGVPMTRSSRYYADAPAPTADSEHVRRLKRAGLVVFGRTNTCELGLSLTCEPQMHGATRNPWDPTRISGGSSGGAAAAVAAGLIPFADGSDLAASVRNPASFCGLVGLRTTPGLVPGDPFDTLGVVGPIARTAPDAALLLAGMCGTDPGLPMARPDRPNEFLGLRPAPLHGLRVAWTFDLGDLPVQPEVLTVLAACRRSLEDAGCDVTDAAPALADADEVFQLLRAARMAAMAPLLHAHRDEVKATLAWNIEKGVALTGEQVAAARAGHAEIFQRFGAFLADGRYEVLALPTVQVLPFPVEQEWVTEINGEPMATYIDWMRSCSRITVTAHPAVSVPAGLTAAGLPVGLQLVGRYGADRRLLEIAAAIMELTELQN